LVYNARVKALGAAMRKLYPGDNMLSDRDVELIRQLYEQHPTHGITKRKRPGVFTQLAEKFGVSRECIYSICHYRRRCD
jgi:hypothetical protein